MGAKERPLLRRIWYDVIVTSIVGFCGGLISIRDVYFAYALLFGSTTDALVISVGLVLATAGMVALLPSLHVLRQTFEEEEEFYGTPITTNKKKTYALAWFMIFFVAAVEVIGNIIAKYFRFATTGKVEIIAIGGETMNIDAAKLTSEFVNGVLSPEGCGRVLCVIFGFLVPAMSIAFFKIASDLAYTRARRTEMLRKVTGEKGVEVDEKTVDELAEEKRKALQRQYSKTYRDKKKVIPEE